LSRGGEARRIFVATNLSHSYEFLLQYAGSYWPDHIIGKIPAALDIVTADAYARAAVFAESTTWRWRIHIWAQLAYLLTFGGTAE